MMVHDFHPAIAAAIRSGANRRGALAALLSVIPIVSAGVMQADAARSQRQGKRTAQSQGKSKKKAKPGPPGPQGPQGGQGPAGPRGPEGPKAITSNLQARQAAISTVAPNIPGQITANCQPGEIAMSGGFSISTPGMVVTRSELQGTNSWLVEARNVASSGNGSITAFVYCLPV